MDRDNYTHGFRLDFPINIATDNVVGYMPAGGYNPTPPAVPENFLLLDTTNFLLLDNTNFLLLS